MVKQLLLISSFAALAINAFAEDDLRSTAISEAANSDKVKAAATEAKTDSIHWTFPRTVGLNLGQTAYSCWAGGGENSVTFSGYLDLQANYKKEKRVWNNDLYGEYGFIYSDSYDDYKTRVNLNKFNFTSKYGYQAYKALYYSALLDFKTQFNGFDYTSDELGDHRQRNSGFLAPANMIASLGMDYIPNKYVSVFVSPITGRFLMCRLDADTSDVDYVYIKKKAGFDVDENGVVDDSKVKSSCGAYFRIINDFDVMKNVHLKSNLDFFSAYADKNGFFQHQHFVCHTIVTWDVLLSMKVNKYINASIRGQLKYDDAVKYTRVNDKGETIERGPETQLMDAINIGFTYNF